MLKLKTLCSTVGTATLLCLGGFNTALAATFTNPENGNQYFLTDPNQGSTWLDAQAQAVAAGGNLVTINDASEQAWINSIFGTQSSYWIGIYDPQGAGAFQWVSGQPVTYTNWFPGEPNFIGSELYGELNPSFGPGQWNNRDNSPSFATAGGIVEIENPTAIPEPSSLLGTLIFGVTSTWSFLQRKRGNSAKGI